MKEKTAQRRQGGEKQGQVAVKVAGAACGTGGTFAGARHVNGTAGRAGGGRGGTYTGLNGGGAGGAGFCFFCGDGPGVAPSAAASVARGTTPCASPISMVTTNAGYICCGWYLG